MWNLRHKTNGQTTNGNGLMTERRGWRLPDEDGRNGWGALGCADFQHKVDRSGAEGTAWGVQSIV